MFTSALSSNILAKAAKRFGTPLYVYDAEEVRGRFRRLDAALAARPHLICYALKANSSRALCAVLAQLGAGAEVVSGGELSRAVKAGFAPGKTVFSGVGKTGDEIEYAARLGVLALNVESAEELAVISRAAKRRRKPVGISVRLNPSVDARTHRHVATATAQSKFGVDAQEALTLFRRAQKDPWLDVRGLQCHLGSQIRTPGPYAAALRAMLELERRLSAEKIRLSCLDIGGGMGVGEEKEGGIDVSQWAGRVLGLLGERPFRLIVEPGRWLVADAGVLLTSVVYSKETPHRRFAVADAGMNDFLRPALYDAKHPVALVTQARGKPRRVQVVGPVCESADFLARDARLPWPLSGAVLAIGKAGAYGFSMASQYNSRPRPAEVLLDGGRMKLARKRETVADLTRGEPAS